MKNQLLINLLSIAVFTILMIGCTKPKNKSTGIIKDIDALTQIPEERFAEMSPEEIRAYEIKVMRLIADFALIPPEINTSPLPEFDYDQLDYGMNMSIELTPQGRLWSIWTAGADGPLAFLVATTSDDNGDTWSKPRLVINNHSKYLPRERSSTAAVLWTDPQSRLWIFFDQSMDHYDGRNGLWAAVCENPDAENPQWSPPRRIWHGWIANKPTVLSTGEWLLPISLGEHSKGYGPFENIFPDLDSLRGINIFASTDKGVSFERRSNSVKIPRPDWHEPMIVEKKDGSLWMLVRSPKGTQELISYDRGKTWSPPSLSAIIHPTSRFYLARLESGRILLIKHGETIDSYNSLPSESIPPWHWGRNMLTAWLSEDDGNTWKGGLQLDEREAISYPDATQSQDGTIFISYDRERSKLGEILMARITEEDILAGEIVTPGSKNKMIISRPLKNRNNKP